MNSELPGLWDHAPWRPLPGRWDGRPVEWGPFELHPKPLCHAERFRDVCPRCGCTAQQPACRGVVWRIPGDPTVREVRTRSGKRYLRDDTVRPGDRSVWGNLWATRCPQCGQDTVLDMHEDTEWLLDESDYWPEGSTP